jgi:glycosyltransferase involved in cell wall biosynthesis
MAPVADPGPLRIAFACYPTSAGPWNPDSAERGIGGSEEAVIHIAAQLTKRGHDVGVYLRNGADRRFAGVYYGPLAALTGERFDIAVVWRRAGLIEQLDRRGASARRAYLWLHDVSSAEVIAAYRHRYHKLIVLSWYHRGRYPELPDEALLVSSNGVDLAQFQPPNPLRDPFQLVYGSDYCRGLRELLTSWPAIRQAVPTARLNVFYGWQGLDRCNPRRAQRLRRTFEPLFRQPGVTHLGRIGHAAVAGQFRRAGVWAYPCSFRETSCITAMKAQAGGAIPAVIPNGALAETVRFGFRTTRCYDDLDGAPGEELVDEWRTGLIQLLSDPDRQQRIRGEMVPACQRAFDWARVAGDWERAFHAQ